MTARRPASPRTLTLDAAAKINLSLEIQARRADGYHEVRTIMQSIDLWDRLEIRVAAGDALRVTTTEPALPQDGENLAGRAVRLVLERLGRRADVRVSIEKRIPAGAGLGGGSADAAGALWGVNRLLGTPLGAGELYRLAARLGSDVAFFLAGGTCHCAGRGEEVRRLPPLPEVSVVLVVPALVVETQWAYANRARIGLTPGRGYTRMLESAIRQRRTSLMAQHLTNDLEDVVSERLPVVQEVKNLLLRGGALGAQLSGSGSALFGLVEDRRAALQLARALRDADHPVHVSRPVRAAIVPRRVHACRPGSRARPDGTP